MTFQLVRASDTDIAVWQTETGHIYVFNVNATAHCLEARFVRDAPDATVPAATFTDEALAYATQEAVARAMLRANR